MRALNTLGTHVDNRATLQDQVASRLGMLPNFFCTAASAPGLIERLWDFARSAYFDSPLPSLFKERLFVHLSRFCEVRYCIVRHVGFLLGQGHPAGDPDCPPQHIDRVVALLRRAIPGETEFAQAMQRLQADWPTIEKPTTDTQREAVTGSLELLQTRIAQGRIGDVDRYVNAAKGAARRAAALTHRLLAFSRRQTLAPESMDVNRLVGGMEELIRRTVGPEIAVEALVSEAGAWPTLVDPGQLENALLNLCINARDAMPDGGKITIETGNRWLDEHAARGLDLLPGEYVSICVSDTGTGMAPEIIAKAFDPFFTTKPIGQGTGLGLSMIYGFAKQSGGQARICSRVGQGTTVCLYLPRNSQHEAAPALLPEPGDAPRADHGQTVLVVDDEPTVRMLATEVLVDLGYRAIEAADGAAGLKVLQSDVRIDLLVTDVGLPGGMNGRQLADMARLVRPNLTMLFITGYAENAMLGHGHLDPGMHVLNKPFELEALARRVDALMRGQGQGGS